MTLTAERAAARRGSLTAEDLLGLAGERTSTGLSEAVARLVRSGDLPAGAQLPTVRELARVGGVSVGTVLGAWSTLREQGLVQTQRRGGTTVLPQAGASFPGWEHIDLSQTIIDVDMHPPLGDALLSALDAETLNVLGREMMTDRLREAVADGWPFAPEAWMTAGGGTEALLLAVEAVAPAGSIVAVDEPLAPGMLDTLRDLGLTAVGVEGDAAGPTPEALRAALEAGATAFVLQPGAPFAAAHVVTPERISQLAGVIDAHDGLVWVVEDDSIGPLESRPSPSLGSLLPGRVLRIRSFCKAYGIDVRTSVMGGPAELVDRAKSLRSHGVGSNSRILQNALAHLIRSDEAAAVVATARARYAASRTALIAALRERGLASYAGEEGIVVWVEVPDETAALLALARRGIVVGAGSRAFVNAPPKPLLRLSVTQLPNDDAILAELAGHVADAARVGAREFFD